MNQWANEVNRQFSKEVQMTNKYMKKCSTSLSIQEMQIKTTLRFHLTPVRRLSSRKHKCQPGWGEGGRVKGILYPISVSGN
jgi:hypothetical protein